MAAKRFIRPPKMRPLTVSISHPERPRMGASKSKDTFYKGGAAKSSSNRGIKNGSSGGSSRIQRDRKGRFT